MFFDKTDQFIKVFFDSLGMWEEKHGSEPGLPGHSFTSKQLFWIAFAQVSCCYLAPET